MRLDTVHYEIIRNIALFTSNDGKVTEDFIVRLLRYHNKDTIKTKIYELYKMGYLGIGTSIVLTIDGKELYSSMQGNIYLNGGLNTFNDKVKTGMKGSCKSDLDNVRIPRKEIHIKRMPNPEARFDRKWKRNSDGEWVRR